MVRRINIIALTLLLTCAAVHSTSNSAYPSHYGLQTIVNDDHDLIPVRREVYGDGRIFDISHRYRQDMPQWGTEEGVGQFLWLPHSMKNGSIANNSEMKLLTHTGTHVDAPGHVFDHYFDAGFDVDTLDLEVLNGFGKTYRYTYRLLVLSSGKERSKKMRVLLALLVCTQVLLTGVLCLALSSISDAYPTGYADEKGSCVKTCDDLRPLRREIFEGGEIIDITHQFTTNTPVGIPAGVGQLLTLLFSMKNGSDYNFSELKLPLHAGTHVDAPGHMYENYFEAGFDVDTLDLRVLNGPALVVDVPRDKNLTAAVVKSLNIPRGVRRVLFRTLNTDRRLMWKKEFDRSYVGFTKDGAQWLVDNTDIKLVGLDYLSVAAFVDLIPAHLVFLKSREIILVEGLKLDGVQPGLYSVHCLPLRLVGAEGSPIRCIVMK